MGWDRNEFDKPYVYNDVVEAHATEYIYRTREILSFHLAILPKSKTFRPRRSSSVAKRCKAFRPRRSLSVINL